MAHTVSPATSVNTNLVQKYNINGPRYTSYPTALEFNTNIDDNSLFDAVKKSKAEGLSLYIHIPFCHSLCYYCGCNKLVTRHNNKADIYIDYLEKEFKLKANSFNHLPVKQIHYGGGTPSFLSVEQQSRLNHLIKKYFNFSTKVEMGIEIDPRTVNIGYLDSLAQLGFNRLSIGLQDVDLEVQKAINRVQSTKHIATLTQHAKQIGFESVNLDLIYGLPHQTTTSFQYTLDTIKNLSADRISLFSYAHLPSRFAAQRKIKDEWLPSTDTKLSLMTQAIEELVESGFELIGMDHFAKPSDELAVAQRNGQLHRNFQGYTTQGDLDLLAFGVSSISSVHNVYAQNPKSLSEYYNAIDTHANTTEKGIELNSDDLIRRSVIQQLMCNLTVEYGLIEAQYNIDFQQYFASEIEQLFIYEKEGLLEVSDRRISVKQNARLLIRMICMVFDVYLNNKSNRNRFSKVI